MDILLLVLIVACILVLVGMIMGRISLERAILLILLIAVVMVLFRYVL